MSSAATWLSYFQSRGIRLFVTSTGLRCDDERALTPGDRSVLVTHTAALVAQLRQPTAAALPADLRELWEERAAIMEYDGGLSRAEAERQALRCVLGLPTEGTEAPCGRVAS